MPGATLVSLLDAALIAGIAMTALKLLVTGLYKRYTVFFLYFVFRIPNSILPIVVDVRSRLYYQIWSISECITLLFYVLLVVELYRLVLERYRGLQTVGRWAMYSSVVVSAAISIFLNLLPKIHDAASPATRRMNILIVTERGIDTALAVFILLLLLFLSRYPVKLSPNARVHAVIYSVFFLSNTVNLLMRTLFGWPVAVAVNTTLTVINVCSVLAWLILLSPAGEEVRITHSGMAPEHEKRLLTQLDFVNTTLLRVSRQQSR